MYQLYDISHNNNRFKAQNARTKNNNKGYGNTAVCKF